MQLYLDNLPLIVSERDIYHLLSGFGCIISVTVNRNSHGRSLCNAYITIKEKVDGRRIIAALHNTNFKAHYLTVYEI